MCVILSSASKAKLRKSVFDKQNQILTPWINYSLHVTYLSFHLSTPKMCNPVNSWQNPILSTRGCDLESECGCSSSGASWLGDQFGVQRWTASTAFSLVPTCRLNPITVPSLSRLVIKLRAQVLVDLGPVSSKELCFGCIYAYPLTLPAHNSRKHLNKTFIQISVFMISLLPKWSFGDSSTGIGIDLDKLK